MAILKDKTGTGLASKLIDDNQNVLEGEMESYLYSDKFKPDQKMTFGDVVKHANQKYPQLKPERIKALLSTAGEDADESEWTAPTDDENWNDYTNRRYNYWEGHRNGNTHAEYSKAKKYFTDLTNQLFKKYNGVTDGYLQELKATAANVLKNKPAGWQVAWDEFNEKE